jgi:hypothetical protein
MTTKKVKGGMVCALLALSSVALSGTSPAQQSQKPLTNDGVMQMVQAGISESVIVAAILSSPAKYDTSTDGLIKLKKAGVTPDEMKAIIAAQQGAKEVGPDTGRAKAVAENGNPASAPSGPKWHMPTVTLLESGASRELPMERTQLAETKTKPHSLASLAGDSAVTQGIQAGVTEASWSAASHINNGMGGSAVVQAGGIFNGIMSRRQSMVTYVWGVPGPGSSNVLQTTIPKFAVKFANAPGVNPDEFAPQVVKLTPAQNTCRLVGATQGKEDARSHDTADWEIYSSFVEDRVAVNLQKTAPGEYEMLPQSALLPGEYAVVLRPVSRSEKVSGGDVARRQGPGLVFDTVWSFRVADDAQ